MPEWRWVVLFYTRVLFYTILEATTALLAHILSQFDINFRAAQMINELSAFESPPEDFAITWAIIKTEITVYTDSHLTGLD